MKKIGERNKNYEENLEKFDSMIKEFPTGQALGLNLKKFPDGVSPHAGNAGGTKTTQGTF